MGALYFCAVERVLERGTWGRLLGLSLAVLFY